MSVICPNSCCEGRRRGPEPGAGVPELVLQAALLTLRRPLLTPGAVVSGEADRACESPGLRNSWRCRAL